MNFLSVSFFHFLLLFSLFLSLIYSFFLFIQVGIRRERIPFNGNSWDFVGLFLETGIELRDSNIRGISRDDSFIYYA